MSVLNYTTQIDSFKSIAEIQKILAKHGAKRIIVNCDEDANPNNLTFSIDWNGTEVGFSLPCRYDKIQARICSMKKASKKFRTTEHAIRVGWRTIRLWIQAQMDMVENELVTLEEIFLPYAITKNGDTLYDSIREDNQIILLGMSH